MGDESGKAVIATSGDGFSAGRYFFAFKLQTGGEKAIMSTVYFGIRSRSDDV